MIQAMYDQLTLTWANTKQTTKTQLLFETIKERLSANQPVERRDVHTWPELDQAEEEMICMTLASMNL